MAVVDAGDVPKGQPVQRVEHGFFALLQARALRGGLDIAAGRWREDAPVAVVSEALWRRAFEGRGSPNEHRIAIEFRCQYLVDLTRINASLRSNGTYEGICW